MNKTEIWANACYCNQVSLVRTYFSHLMQAVEWRKIHLLRKLAKIDEHRDGASISKLTPESLFLFYQPGFILFKTKLRELFLQGLFCFFSGTKDNNGVQNFLIYPNNDSKCAILWDNK